jgi:peptidoglycan/LPS O-acetylase OafA/YrhL
MSNHKALVSAALYNKYYPSLNGFRAIAIMLVVINHLSPYFKTPYLSLINGPLGVAIFFVLSGFLITTLLIKEKEITGRLSLKSFYIRRILRIFPVALLYILVILLLNNVYALNIPAFQFWGAALYVMDFSYFRSHNFEWLLGHYWSLSVEEQFYLIFPFLLMVNIKLFKWIVVFVVFGIPLICVIQYFFPGLNQGLPYYLTHFLIKFQAIGVGCLFSLLAFNKFFDGWIDRFKIYINLLAICLICWLRFEDFYSINAVFNNLVISVLVGYVIVSNLLPANDYFYRLLNTRLFNLIGILSYSIYIWQQLFLSGYGKLPKILAHVPYSLILLLIVPVASYFFYEKYFLKLKDKFKVVN